MGFRSEAEMGSWLQDSGAEPGYVASAQTMFDLAGEWFGGRSDEGWRPPSAEQAEAMFRRHGLMGEFWSLTG